MNGFGLCVFANWAWNHTKATLAMFLEGILGVRKPFSMQWSHLYAEPICLNWVLNRSSSIHDAFTNPYSANNQRSRKKLLPERIMSIWKLFLLGWCFWLAKWQVRNIEPQGNFYRYSQYCQPRINLKSVQASLVSTSNDWKNDLIWGSLKRASCHAEKFKGLTFWWKSRLFKWKSVESGWILSKWWKMMKDLFRNEELGNHNNAPGVCSVDSVKKTQNSSIRAFLS